MRGPRCDVCDKPVDPDVMHLLHDDDCPRPSHDAGCNSFLGYPCECVWCRCDRWGCADCCADAACVTPLAARTRAAHDEYVASIDLEDAS